MILGPKWTGRRGTVVALVTTVLVAMAGVASLFVVGDEQDGQNQDALVALSMVAKDLDGVIAAASRQDAQNLRASCLALERSATVAAADPVRPDPGGIEEVRGALGHIGRAAQHCVAITGSLDAGDLAGVEARSGAFAAELAEGTKAARRALVRIREGAGLG